MVEEVMTAAETAHPTFPEPAQAVKDAARTLLETTEWLVTRKPDDRFAVAAPYLRAFARVLGAHFHLRAALVRPGGAREALARFHIARLLPDHIGLCAQVREGSEGVYALSPEHLAE